MPECDACGISIGPKYIETKAHTMRENKICGHCLQQLRRYGRIQMRPYNDKVFLLPHGRTESFKKPRPPQPSPDNNNDEDEHDDNEAEDFEDYG